MKESLLQPLDDRRQREHIGGERDDRDDRVCLLLEGTYPYVFGGVSAWVDQILRAMPERPFDVTYIGSRRAMSGDPKYELPPNLANLHEIYLHDGGSPAGEFSNRVKSCARRALVLVGDYFMGRDCDPMILLNAACDLASTCSLRDFWELPETWSLLREIYQMRAPDCSFKKFYWNVWNFVAHLWELLSAVDHVPIAPVYHAVCTGYAGMLGALLKHRRGARFLLSEHGVYVKERIEDMRTANWIADPGERVPTLATAHGTLTELWMQFFLFQARVSYDAADRIVSLFERNATTQEEFGAAREKIQIIPNGVAEAVLPHEGKREEWRSERSDWRPTVGFLGRIVPIKDIKTLLRAVTTLRERCDGVTVLVAGPVDEEPDYYVECLELVKSLELEDTVQFVGKVAACEFLLKIDVMALTSLSEGLPFAILEAFSHSVPVVATDVGACRELIEGGGSNRSGAGRAGLITPVAEPEQTGAAMALLLNDHTLRKEYGNNGRIRAAGDYALTDVVASYAKLYDA